MNILYLSSSHIPSRTANSVQVMKMTEAFASLGHRVTLVATHGQEQTPLHASYGTAQTFGVIFLPWPPIPKVGSLIYALNCYRHLVANREDYELAYGRSLYALCGAAKAGIPVIYESHAPPRTPIHAGLERLLFARKSFERLVVISEALKEIYRRQFPNLRPEQITVAHDGASPVQFETSENHPWPGRKGVMQAGYIGSLYPGRGLDLIGEMSKRLPNVDFHIAGGSGPEIASWRKVFPGDNVYFHGFLPHKELAPVFAALDVALAPYQERVSVAGGKGDTAKWMSPLKIFEYMAAEKAIIASDLPPIREVLRHNENAVLIPPNDVSKWQHEIERLEADPSLRNALGQQARRDFEENFTWDIRARRVLDGVSVTGNE